MNSEFITAKEQAILGDMALIKADYRKGVFKGLASWQGAVIVDKSAKSKQKQSKQQVALKAAVEQALRTKQFQLMFLRSVVKEKERKELESLLESTMKQLCPYCAGGVATGLLHCHRGKDPQLFLIAQLLFQCLQFSPLEVTA